MKDTLGDRMKGYEDCYRFKLPKRGYTMIRVDGKAFHTYTRGLRRPFDDGLIEDMNKTAEYLCKNMMGAKFAYVQSDEISILLTDFEKTETQPWFENNVQKMVSVAASMATAMFNFLRLQRYFSGPTFNVVTEDAQIDTVAEHYQVGVNLENVHDDIASFINYLPIKNKMAEFDARVWLLPNKTEVENYFIWRQQDATRNSISSVAQSLYSHKELNSKSSDEKQEMIFQKGINWNDFDSGKKRGRFVEKVTFVNGVEVSNKLLDGIAFDAVVRNKWTVVECPVFTQDRMFLRSRVPTNEV